MRDVLFRHGQDRDHRNGALVVTDTSRAFIHRCKVGVHIAGIAAASRDFLTRCGHLAERFRIVRDIRDDNEHVHPEVIRKILCRGNRHTGCCDTLDRRIVRKVDKRDCTLDGAGLAEIADEEVCFFKRNADSGKHDRKFLVGAEHLCLTRDLRGEVCVRQTGSGEHRQLLSADKCIQAVDRGNTRLYKLGRIVARSGVHRRAIDVQMLLGNQRRAVIHRLAHAVEHAAQHIGRNVQLDGLSEKTGFGVADAQALRAFEQLKQRLVAIDFQNAAAANASVRLLDLDQFVIFDAGHIFYEHQRSNDFFDGTIFLTHPAVLPRSNRRSACSDPR